MFIYAAMPNQFITADFFKDIKVNITVKFFYVTLKEIKCANEMC